MASGPVENPLRVPDRGRPGRARRMGAAWGAAAACVAAGASALLLSPATSSLPTEQERGRLEALVANVGAEGRQEHEGSTLRPWRSTAATLAELQLYDIRRHSPAPCASYIDRRGEGLAAPRYRPSPPSACRSAAPIRRPAS